jgi:hypothetical protein
MNRKFLGRYRERGGKADERIEHPNPTFKTASDNIFYGRESWVIR